MKDVERKERIKERLGQLKELIRESTQRAIYDDRFDDVVRNFEAEEAKLKEELKKIEKDEFDR